MFEFKLPDLGEGVHEGEVLQWFVKPGDTIAEDAPLIEVETDKAAVTIPSPRGGRVVSIHGEVGQVIHTGDVICVIDDAGAKPSAKKSVEPAKAAEPAKAVESPVIAAPAPIAAKSVAEPGRPVPAAPATRKLARELNVDLRLVPPSGPGGRVTPDDVRAFASGSSPARAVTTPDEPLPA
ncbi:MAG: E3 binding domain-containing protein, partial [Deltaproteobacteria bacterium]|nr:E3 binding domain-containing protein [Deltaproteobacteria bacterium]